MSNNKRWVKPFTENRCFDVWSVCEQRERQFKVRFSDEFIASKITNQSSLSSSYYKLQNKIFHFASVVVEISIRLSCIDYHTRLQRSLLWRNLLITFVALISHKTKYRIHITTSTGCWFDILTSILAKRGDEFSSIRAMGLITLKKFLCCMKLETGGKILGWLSIVSSALSVITFAALIFIANVALVYVNGLHNDISFRGFTFSPNYARIGLISECARKQFSFVFYKIYFSSCYRG